MIRSATRRRMANIGSSEARFAGIEIPRDWHGPAVSPSWRRTLLANLRSTRAIIIALDQQPAVKMLEDQDRPGQAGRLQAGDEERQGDASRKPPKKNEVTTR